jgi:hypothetical protein
MTVQWTIGLAGSLLLVGQLSAQDTSSFARPVMRFGFFVSADRCTPSVSLRPRSGPPTMADSIAGVSPVPQPGFSMGVVYEQALTGRLAFRVMPSLNFSTASLEYDYDDGATERRAWESTELGLSVQAIGVTAASGHGPCLAIGPTLKYNVDKEAPSDRIRYSIDGAAGVRFRVANFFMAPELRYSYSLTDLVTDESSIQTQVIDEFRGHVLSLAIVFQD